MKNVNRFVKTQVRSLRAFETWWIEHRMVDPDSESYPEEMGDADWLEQFEMFCLEQEETEEN